MMFCALINFVYIGAVILHVGAFSSPLLTNGVKDLSESALIDCSHATLEKRMQIAKIPYRCLDETDRLQRDFISGHLKAPEEELILLETEDCSDPRRCKTKLTAALTEVCQDDFVFVAALDECVPRSRNNCKMGYSNDPETGRCVLNNRHSIPQNDKPLGFFSSHKCPPGYVYSSEIDRCQLIVKPPVSIRPPVASLVLDKPADVPTSNSEEVVGKKKCTKGMVYVSELDICVPYEKPKASSEIRHKRSLAPKSAPSWPSAVGLHHSAGHVGKKKCTAGQVYVSEIDHCVDYKVKNSAEQ